MKNVYFSFDISKHQTYEEFGKFLIKKVEGINWSSHIYINFYINNVNIHTIFIQKQVITLCVIPKYNWDCVYTKLKNFKTTVVIVEIMKTKNLPDNITNNE